MGGYSEERDPNSTTDNVYEHISCGLSASQFGRREPCKYSAEVRLPLHLLICLVCYETNGKS